MFHTRWSDRLENSAQANSQSSHSCISHTIFHTQTSIWNNHPALWRCYCSQSSGVIIWNIQHIQTANKLLLCIPWCRVVCVCASPEHILFFAFHWDEPDHLKLRFEKKKPSVFLTLPYITFKLARFFGKNEVEITLKLISENFPSHSNSSFCFPITLKLIHSKM